jgi:hypothetical protein
MLPNWHCKKVGAMATFEDFPQENTQTGNRDTVTRLAGLFCVAGRILHAYPISLPPSGPF